MSTLLGGAAPSSATKAANVAAIKAVLTNSTYLPTAETGDKYAAATELMSWIRSQLGSIASTDAVPGDRQDYVRAVAATVDVQRLVVPWVQTVGRDNWKNNPRWPTSEEMSASEKTAALIKARDALKSVAVQLTDHYANQRKELLDGLPAEYDLKVTPQLPAITVRNIESRAYVLTYVTDWGWESAPSPPTDIIDVDENDVVHLEAAIPPSGRNIVKMRLYRSSTTNAGAAFQFVVENAANVSDWTVLANRQYDDTKKQATLGETCPTMGWDEPPDDMFGLTTLANGVAMGFRENQILFSEPFVPYAWPLAYRLTTDTKIVGGGVIGSSAVVATEGQPYYVSGVDSANMSAQKMEFSQACVSRRTIAAGDGGVLYASPDGICVASASGVNVITEGAISRRDWQAFLGAQNLWSSAFAGYHEGVYYIFNSTGAGYAVDIKSKRLSTLTQSCSGIYSDMLTDKLYVVTGTSLIDLFGSASTNTATWRSRIFVVNDQPGFSAWRVESDFESAVTAKFYGDGVLRHTATFTNRLPQRLPAGRYRDVEVQIETACRVTRVTLATSMSELQ